MAASTGRPRRRSRAFWAGLVLAAVAAVIVVVGVFTLVGYTAYILYLVLTMPDVG